jgi:hypothetical protein
VFRFGVVTGPRDDNHPAESLRLTGIVRALLVVCLLPFSRATCMVTVEVMRSLIPQGEFLRAATGRLLDL